jgi:hypothetical protein
MPLPSERTSEEPWKRQSIRLCFAPRGSADWSYGALWPEAHKRVPRQIILDLDATDDPLHGEQEGRFFHGYYDCYCYLPLGGPASGDQAAGLKLLRSLPHGHVAAALGMLRKVGLDGVLSGDVLRADRIRIGSSFVELFFPPG